MSTDIESRLRAALEARAEMVTVEALAPPSPGAERPRPWWRSESGMLFIAAVCVIVLAIPMLAMGLARELPRQDAGPDDGPSAGSDVSGSDPTGATDSPATLSTPLTGDVDGDGKDDVVRLASGGDLPEGVTEVQAELTQRGTQAWTSEPGQDPELARLADVDGEPGAEIFVDLGSGPAGLVVLTVGESQLGTIHRSDVALGLDQAGLLHGWWVSGSRLRTSVSTEKVPPGAETYAVEASEWRPGDGELLVATPLGRWCVRASDPETLLECEAASADPSESSSPSVSATPGEAPSTASSDRWWEGRPAGVPTAWAEQNAAVDRLPIDIGADGEWGEYVIEDNALVWREGGRTASTPIVGGDATLVGYWGDHVVVRSSFHDHDTATWQWSVWRHEVDESSFRQLRVPDGHRFGTQSGLEGDEWVTWLQQSEGSGGITTMEYLDQGSELEDRQFPGWKTGLRIHRVSFYLWDFGDVLRRTPLGDACVVPGLGTAVYGCPPE